MQSTDTALNTNAFVSTFYFLADTQANTKKIKRACKPTHGDSANLTWPTYERKEERTDNSTYPKGRVSCFADTFVQAKCSVLRMKFSGKNPALRIAANR